MTNLPFNFQPCPRECKRECGAGLSRCLTFQKVPRPLKEKCEHNLHLLQYLQALYREKGSLPEYYGKLERSMKGLKSPNVIYPVSDEIFIHVLGNPEDIRNFYIPVEPSIFGQTNGLLEEIEDYLADFVEELEEVQDEDERVQTVLHIVDQLVEVRGGRVRRFGQQHSRGGTRNGKPKIKAKRKITLTPLQYQGLFYQLRAELKGLGILEPMIRDNYIEDISCSGLGNIFVEHKIFSGLRTTIGFNSHEELDKFVIQLAERIKHPVTFRDPVVDATLPDGSRINIVYGTDVSKKGSNFTIRKFSPIPMSIIELIQLGTLNHEMAAYLSIVIQEGMNVWISGETASGKTTLLNALATFIPPESKIVSIEDTPEIQVPHPNWIRGVTRGSAKNSEASEVSMFDLLKAALRQRPNVIIVGEIRGIEGAIAFQAMQTGHACMSTFHAASVSKLLQRLTGNPINVPKSYVDNLNVVVITQMVRLPSGKTARRVISINEIVSYDSVSDSFSFVEAFVWNPVNDAFEFKGYMNSYVLEEKIAPRRGIPHVKRQQIYQEIRRRAEVLRRIQKQKITNFYDVYQVLSKAYREGYFR